MKTERIISDLIKSLVDSGVYKDEYVAIKDIVVTHIEKKIETYNKTIQAFQKKHGIDFERFTSTIQNKATPELEDDWMEWKGAIEMKAAWDEALKEVMEFEAKV